MTAYRGTCYGLCANHKPNRFTRIERKRLFMKMTSISFILSVK
nr:MAG TPA: hypothetical protein [Caudoviricetes sp.]